MLLKIAPSIFSTIKLPNTFYFQCNKLLQFFAFQSCINKNSNWIHSQSLPSLWESKFKISVTMTVKSSIIFIIFLFGFCRVLVIAVAKEQQHSGNRKNVLLLLGKSFFLNQNIRIKKLLKCKSTLSLFIHVTYSSPIRLKNCGVWFVWLMKNIK
jgi:hypothetical protein